MTIQPLEISKRWHLVNAVRWPVRWPVQTIDHNVANIRALVVAISTKQSKTQSTRNHASSPGSVNATNQTQRSQQPDEQRRKDNIRLKQLPLATYYIQTLQHLGKIDQLTRKAVALPTDIIACQKENHNKTRYRQNEKWQWWILIYLCNSN